jgi:transglutaminase superfamily protein
VSFPVRSHAGASSGFPSRLKRMMLLRAIGALRLPYNDQRLLWEALFWNVSARLGLWILSFRKLRSWLRRLARVGPQRDLDFDPERLAWAVGASSCLVPFSTCLNRALALQMMLGRRGIPAVLRIGVKNDGEEPLEAHAWIELEGREFLGGPGRKQFAAMDDLAGGGLTRG